ncbi:MAG: VPLPA-CTERM sorting domain-containing protein [Sulfuricaulis sp.]|uniref:VPLPA-CTERM sorting domain-containing protein n=1 Tax=Sulfuricaulis sp. TaxID=2003553 RepID=UPI0025DFC096|nr:VPLPA-CTERM sorting domain-containing protein [Sulfuricaulis sp.]MCR4347386.1 VPLPA-CTERM sorting domain-containing protein [Sulfuricaulis sp.]
MNKQLKVLALIAALGFSGAANAAPVSGQGTWETTLQGRDLDGNLSTFEAYYDTALNITWLANTNYAGTTMTWANANTWASGLNINGYTGWRLPTVSPVDGTTADDATIAYNGTEDRGYNVSAPGTLYAGSTASEMAHMFYNTLGDKGYCTPTSVYPSCTNQSGWGPTNTGPFSNVQSSWSATEYAPSTSSAWFFNISSGYQNLYNKPNSLSAWAVHSGDVGASAVPVPAAVWLFGSGLLGLIGVARRKKA